MMPTFLYVMVLALHSTLISLYFHLYYYGFPLLRIYLYFFQFYLLGTVFKNAVLLGHICFLFCESN